MILSVLNCKISVSGLYFVGLWVAKVVGGVVYSGWRVTVSVSARVATGTHAFGVSTAMIGKDLRHGPRWAVMVRVAILESQNWPLGRTHCIPTG